MTKIIGIMLKLFAVVAALAIVAFCSLFAWLYFYTRDLPDVSSLRLLDPSVAAKVDISVCGETTTILAVSTTDLSKEMREAVVAAEGDLNAGVWEREIAPLIRSNDSFGNAPYSAQLARELFCEVPTHSVQSANRVLVPAGFPPRRFAILVLCT